MTIFKADQTKTGEILMKDIVYKEAKDYSLEKVTELKGDRKLYVVFSTFGEREAELINEKITLLREKTGDLIDRIFLSHRRSGAAEELTESKAREADPSAEIIVCNDYRVPDMGDEKGKGADMRRTLFHINRHHCDKEEDPVIVFLDADVVEEYFGEHFVLGLAGPVYEGCDFSKAGFWREMGRVKKFVAQPLFSVIEHPVLNNLRDLSYPLSGEVAGRLSFFNSVKFWQMYGVETGVNIDAFMGGFKTADVNLGLYDHEHHGDVNIQKMCFGIIRTYLMKLLEYGIIELKDSASISHLFKASYIDEGADRQRLDFDLTERKYQPLYKLFE